MVNLNNEIIAYLTVNNIPYAAGDYQTGQPEGQPDQILFWDTAKLGAQPTQAQLDEAYPIWENRQLAADNKAKGKTILSDTDWTAIASVGDPAESNPYLVNRSDFLTYRSAVRAIVLAPTFDAVFPTAPVEQWS